MITAEQLDHGHALARALGDWLDRGARWAVIPQRLLDLAAAGRIDGDAWAHLAEVMSGRCRAHWQAGSDAVVLWHVCLLEHEHEGPCGYDLAGLEAAEAWAEQMDPVARIARRAAHAAGMKVGAVAYVEVTP